VKPRLAAVLSLAGVLSAGTAAALVNTQVLESPDASGTPAAASVSTSVVDASSTSVDVPVTVAPSTPTVPSSTTVAAPSTVVPVAVEATTAEAVGTYQLGDGGTVTLSTTGDLLTIVAVDPAPGWMVKNADQKDVRDIEVRLRSDDREVRFEAHLLFGVVSTSLRTDDD
jgi:hypothetical protein